MRVAATYTPGVNLTPLSADTDNDTVPDGSDPPALWSAPDNQINAADLLIVNHLVLGHCKPGQLQFVHGDMNVDGVINPRDLQLIEKLVLS